MKLFLFFLGSSPKHIILSFTNDMIDTLCSVNFALAF